MVDKYSRVDVGSSYLPNDVSAAYLWGQLQSADEINQNRLSSWRRYFEKLAPLGDRGFIELPTIPKECAHNAHMFYIKTKDLDGYACLSFYYVDNNGETVGETRGFNRSISGTLDWTKDEVVIDVPKTAKYLSLGIMINGNNKIGSLKSYPEVWIDNLNIDEVSKDVILTDTKMNTKPINLDFEE